MPTRVEDKTEVTNFRTRRSAYLESTKCVRPDTSISNNVEPGDITFGTTSKGLFPGVVHAVDGLWSHAAIVAGRLGDLHSDCDGGASCPYVNHPMPIAKHGEDRYELIESCSGHRDEWVVVHQRFGGLVAWGLEFQRQWSPLMGVMRPNREKEERSAAGAAAFQAWLAYPGDADSNCDLHPEDNRGYGWEEVMTSGWLSIKADIRTLLRFMWNKDNDQRGISDEEFRRLAETLDEERPWSPDEPQRTSCGGFVQHMYQAAGDIIRPRFLMGTRVQNGKVMLPEEVLTIDGLLTGEPQQLMAGLDELLPSPLDQHELDASDELVCESYENLDEFARELRNVDLHSKSAFEKEIRPMDQLVLAVAASRQRFGDIRGGALVADATSPNDLWASPEAECRLILPGVEDVLENYSKEYFKEKGKQHSEQCPVHKEEPLQ